MPTIKKTTVNLESPMLGERIRLFWLWLAEPGKAKEAS
jgi:hypothetical protein